MVASRHPQWWEDQGGPPSNSAHMYYIFVSHPVKSGPEEFFPWLLAVLAGPLPKAVPWLVVIMVGPPPRSPRSTSKETLSCDFDNSLDGGGGSQNTRRFGKSPRHLKKGTIGT